MMTEEENAVANGPIMWILALAIVGMVVFQSILFRRQAVKYANEHNLLTKEQISKLSRIGITAAIGPAIAVIVVALSLVANVGGPMTLMRVGIIGSAGTELRAATTSAMVAGITLGQQPLTMKAFGAALFGCTFMASGYLVGIPIIVRLMEAGLKAANKAGNGGLGNKILTYLMIVPLGMIFWMIYNYCKASMVNLVCVITGFLVKILCDVLAKKISWMDQWSLGFAVLAGMASSIVANAFMA